MSPFAISLIILAIIFGGALLGMFLRSLLPEHHLSAESKDVMKMGNGVVATMAALVLGLLVSSAKGTFDTMNSGLKQTATKIFLLDRTLAQYGPETGEARDMLRHRLAITVQRVWPDKNNEIALEKVGQTGQGLEDLEKKIRQLSPKNDEQRGLQAKAQQIAGDIEEARLNLVLTVGQSSIPPPFLIVLICWLVIIFFNFGIFTSRNTSVVAVLFVSAVSVASSLFLILELDQPYAGLIKISSSPLLNALAHLGK